MGNKAAANLGQNIQNYNQFPQISNNTEKVVLDGNTYIRYSACLDRKEYLKWKEALEDYQRQNHLFLPHSHHFTASSLCGSAGTLEAQYPNYPHLLSTQISQRVAREVQTDFSEPQIWYLLFSLITAEKEALQGGEMLGDLRPQNITLGEQEGMLKVICLHSLPIKINKYQKALAGQGCYLAPQELPLENIDTCFLTEPAEMFSLGLTLLSAANLVEYKRLYNYERGKFDMLCFESALLELQINSTYSQVLKGTISNLCSLDPNLRMSLKELWSLLAGHKEAIVAKNNFVIGNAPQRLHKQVQLLRTIMAEKTANYPSSLPDLTNQGMASNGESSFFQKLVPSHLNENSPSALTD